MDMTRVDWSKVGPKALPWLNPETEAVSLEAIAKFPGGYTLKAALLASLEVVKQTLNVASAVPTAAEYISVNIAVPAGTRALDLTHWAADNAGKFINIRSVALCGRSCRASRTAWTRTSRGSLLGRQLVRRRWPHLLRSVSTVRTTPAPAGSTPAGSAATGTNSGPPATGGDHLSALKAHVRAIVIRHDFSVD
ncbi:hypothetical protein Asppvi_010108 [Aspergillus pseudoviridinutans]|uniref:Uncharacterized protein n=1 Tax=Aspergillus pseudoviridinutans TaxID=1517512 RepID=A0A9P3BMM4_9EURO|nr:uncharacterized protein Asppvi_010108 [Aspergillus pseudoviridinutans]GIJ91143.1 hypothetical protein Asppvi_010108 [Aspergillus pseudoviridinutans]